MPKCIYPCSGDRHRAHVRPSSFLVCGKCYPCPSTPWPNPSHDTDSDCSPQRTSAFCDGVSRACACLWSIYRGCARLFEIPLLDGLEGREEPLVPCRTRGVYAGSECLFVKSLPLFHAGVLSSGCEYQRSLARDLRMPCPFFSLDLVHPRLAAASGCQIQFASPGRVRGQSSWSVQGRRILHPRLRIPRARRNVLRAGHDGVEGAFKPWRGSWVALPVMRELGPDARILGCV